MAKAPAKTGSKGASAGGDDGEISAASRVVILHGKDRFLQDGYLAQLKEALVKAHGADGVDTVRFDAAQGGASILADVMDECRSQGLMQQHKVVIIENAELVVKEKEEDGEKKEKPVPVKGGAKKGAGRARVAGESPREVLEIYCESPSETATLVLRASTWRPGNLDKAAARVGFVKKCEPPTEGEAVSWAMKRSKKRHGAEIARDAAELMVEFVGADLGRIDHELEKLALAAGGKGEPITRDLVAEMTGATRAEDFWAIQGTLVGGDAEAALKHLHDLLEISRHDAVPLMFAYVEMARKLHVAASARAAGQSPQSAFKHLKVWGPGSDRMIEGIMRIAGRVSPEETAELLHAAVSADKANKSGGGDQVRLLEGLTVRFAMMGK